ncbi:MAG: ABC transporter ATP-binding protein [Polyangiaceae bacterium]|nr:ABC transporter ATP-binding protein [Polyangiaceae bacterium]
MSLVIKGIQKRFGGREVLRGLELVVERGETVAVVGPNGAGKSTLLGVVAGIIEPEAGSVTLEGEPLIGRRAPARARLGFVPEGADPPPHLLAGELLALCAALKQVEILPTSLLERLGVAALLEQPVGSMSLGQRRRTCLAAALVGEPLLLVLDEPTNGLDPGGVEMLASLLRDRREAGGMALISTHDRAFAEAAGAKLIRLEIGRAAQE